MDDPFVVTLRTSISSWDAMLGASYLDPSERTRYQYLIAAARETVLARTRKTTPPAPFQIGDRVRMKKSFRPKLKRRTGHVSMLDRYEGLWRVNVQMDAGGQRHTYVYHNEIPSDSDWELIPDYDTPIDETAAELARLVLNGDMHAARALADRVCELVNAVCP